MNWIHMKAAPGQGVEEQHLLRIGPVPAISLKRDHADDRWVAWILERSGVSARAIYFARSLTLMEAKAEALKSAAEIGWST